MRKHPYLTGKLYAAIVIGILAAATAIAAGQGGQVLLYVTFGAPLVLLAALIYWLIYKR